MGNRQDPRQHFKYRFPGIRYPRKTETVASDTFFPTVKTRRESDRWEVYPLKTESHNGVALQDYSRN
eukprot:7189035-Ditylum_brightwellii.AAC.1